MTPVYVARLLSAVTLRSIGGLRPPFLEFKNADAKRRLCEGRRLEGWKQARSLLPSFETRPTGHPATQALRGPLGAPQDDGGVCFTRSQDDVALGSQGISQRRAARIGPPPLLNL